MLSECCCQASVPVGAANRSLLVGLGFQLQDDPKWVCCLWGLARAQGTGKCIA